MAGKCRMCGLEITKDSDIGPKCFFKVKNKLVQLEYENYSTPVFKNLEYSDDVKALSQDRFKQLLTKKSIPEKKDVEFEIVSGDSLTLDLMISLNDFSENNFYDGKEIFNLMKESGTMYNDFFKNMEYEAFYTPFYEDGENRFLGSLLLKFKEFPIGKTGDLPYLLIPLYSNNEEIYFRDYSRISFSGGELTLKAPFISGKANLTTYESENLSEYDLNPLISTNADLLKNSLGIKKLNDSVSLSDTQMNGRPHEKFEIINVQEISELTDSLSLLPLAMEIKNSTGGKKQEAIRQLEIAVKNKEIFSEIMEPGSNPKAILGDYLYEIIEDGADIDQVIRIYDNPLYRAAFHKEEFYSLFLTIYNNIHNIKD